MFALNWKPPWVEKGELYLQYAEVYQDAVKQLLNGLQEGGHSYKPLPVLFLLRHYIEIQLTGLVMYGSIFSFKLSEDIDEFLEKNRKDHSLQRVFHKLKECEYCLKFPKDFTSFLTNLERFDKASDRFRYPENRNGTLYFNEDICDKRFFDIINNPDSLEKYITLIIDNLEGIETYFDIVKEGKEEEYRNNIENNTSA